MAGEELNQSSDGQDTPEDQGEKLLPTGEQQDVAPNADWTPDQSAEQHADTPPPEASEPTVVRDKTFPSDDWKPDPSIKYAVAPQPEDSESTVVRDKTFPSDDWRPNQSAEQHDNNQAQLTPEDEQRYVGQMQNKDKDEDEARAAEQHRNEAIADDSVRDWPAEHRQSSIAAGMDYAMEEAGDQYELEALADRTGEESKKLFDRMHNDINSLIVYGHDIIENQRQHGEALTPNQEAFEAIRNFLDEHFIGKSPNDSVPLFEGKNGLHYFLNFRESRHGSLLFEVAEGSLSHGDKAETWAVNPWRGRIRSWYADKYSITTRSREGTDYVTTTRERDLTTEDVDHLKQLLTDYVPKEGS
jgi:hypothetical protein